jgi:hypothetical protein
MTVAMVPENMDDEGFPARVADAVTINETALNEEYIRIPSDIAFLGQQYATAYRRAGEAKIRENKLEAATTISIRAQAAASNEKLTLPDLAARVDTDEEVVLARLETVRAEAEKLRVRGYYDAVLAKKDMVISIGATLREEMKSTPSLRNEARDSRSSHRNNGE